LSIFDLIYLAVIIMLSPLLPFKILSDRRFRSNLAARCLAPGQQATTIPEVSTTLIWVHAASIGEIRLALTLIDAWKQADPRKSFLISTNTVESRELGQQATFTPVVLAPLDFSPLVRRFIRKYDPRHLVLIETEIWPNMIRLMSRRGKVSIMNGRLSNRYFDRYRRINALLRGTLAGVEIVMARDATSSARFLALGIPAEKIICPGNLKYELPEIPDASAIEAERASVATPGAKPFLMVAGSIQPEELHTILPAWNKLRNRINGFQLVMVPRHPDKKNSFAEILSQYQVPFVFSSDADSMKARPDNSRIWVVDKLGVLHIWYYLADTIFVGGSLCDRGGQNMVEAVGFRKPVCIGPNTANFRDEVELLTAADGISIITNVSELVAFVQLCHDQPEQAAAMSERGYQAIRAQADALSASISALTRIYR